MDGTLAAGRLSFLEGTFFETQVCIIKKTHAFGAKAVPCTVMIAAVNADHGPDGLAFSRHPGMDAVLHGTISLRGDYHSKDILA